MNTKRSVSSGRPFFRVIFLLSVLMSVHAVRGWGQTPGIPQSQGNRLTGSQIVQGASVDAQYTAPDGIVQPTIKDIISLSINEESPAYLPDNFSASIVLNVSYGTGASSATAFPSTVTLTVNYSKDAGVSYDTKKFISFAGAKYIKVTISSPPTLTPATLSNQVDVLSLLTLKAEIQSTSYYGITTGPSPVTLSAPTAPCSAGAITPDELPVTWSWPSDANINGTQLEWTFVPGDVTVNYFNPDGSPNNQLFRSNSSRVDLPLGVSAYNIPLFYDGTGTIYYRIRAVIYQPSGNIDNGPWTNGAAVAFCGHSPTLNWQANTSYAEDGKRKTVMQYYDGSLRLRQTVTKDNSTNTTLTAETLYDGQGRPAIQVLPAPSTTNIIGYTSGLNLFLSSSPGQADQTATDDAAQYFDLQPVSGAINATPPLSTAGGTAKYYSTGNPELALNGNGNIPDAGGYPYSVTRYTPDGTGRVMSQAGVGQSLKMTSGHETKYFYGSAPQEQLDGLFGTEVGLASHYFKNMVQDANGQMSVSYVDMHGRTIATALAGDASSSMASLDLSQYPGQQAAMLNQNLLPTGGNIIKGNSIESLTSLLVPFGEAYSFTYSLTPDALTLQNCNAPQSICYDCQYDLEVTITDESGEQPPIVRRFTNLSLSSANTCPPGNSLLGDEHVDAAHPSTVTANTITFSEVLPVGSYSVRKTLTVSDAARQQLRAQYAAAAICVPSGCTGDAQQCIIDSIKTVLEAQTNCAAPKGACQNCGVNLLDVIESEMLADMMPYSGQYAQDPTTLSSPNSFNVYGSYSSYDIFATDHYQQLPTGVTYQDASGNTDAAAANLSGMSPADFANVFAPSWAQQLLPFHPEYQELLFAKAHLANSYSWEQGFTNITTYATSGTPDAQGFVYQNSGNTTADVDPFFTENPSQKTFMNNLATVGGYYNNYSLWKIAFATVKCTGSGPSGSPGISSVTSCYVGSPANPSGWGSFRLTQADEDQIWSVYQGLYLSVRDSLLNVYIKNNGSAPGQDALVADGYTLRFPSSMNQVVTQDKFTGFPATAGDPPTIDLAAAAGEAHSTQCSSYINRWTQELMTCPAIASRSDANDIIAEITTRMEAVCEHGLDASNPQGSSSVVPGNVTSYGDNSFEDVINHVFSEKGIPMSQLCNPFIIDYPKPYGKTPLVNQEMMAVVDKCACDRFAALVTEAGVSDFTGLNNYLQATYGQMLTQVEYDALQPEKCALIGSTSNCMTVVYNAPLNSDGSCPCTYVGKIIGDPPADSCYCNKQVCQVIDVYPLSSPQPKPAFLDCGGIRPKSNCLTCSQLSQYVTDFKAYFSALNQDCAAAPLFDNSVDLTDAQIGYNIAFAQFVNYRSGLQYSWTDYVNAAAAAGCNLALANTSATQTVICANPNPLSDPSGLYDTEDPCQKTHQMAIAMGQEIYAARVAQALTNFDQWYSDKCLQAAETFNVSYQVKEFHYTLYYYDQAGTLVKTVPPKGVRPDFSSTFINSVEAARPNEAVTPVVPSHVLVSDYRYNSLNAVVQQKTPDANVSNFFYDYLGRLVVSQNAEQAQPANSKYSYTIYDDLGRITEVGQKPQTTAMTPGTAQVQMLLKDWLLNQGGTREQVTSTVYDVPAPYLNTDLVAGLNLRNRVSYTTTQALFTDAAWNATYYSYDVHGNVDTVVQDYGAVNGIGGDQYKRITYDYDLVSNKVNGVDYQRGLGQDEFYHRYRYDAENRLVQVLSSRDSIFWEQEAAYDYYKHGPLARMVLGQLQTQELRYSYTLQGWLKGINSGGLFNYVPPSGASDGSSCTPGTYLADLDLSSRPASGGPATYTARSSITFEAGFEVDLTSGQSVETTINPDAAACVIPSADGTGGIVPTDPLSFPIAQDAYNFSLHYYPGDYTPVNATTPVTGILEAIPSQAAPLYNGNIAAMAVNLPLTADGSATLLPLSDKGTKVYNYHYDQLNRLMAMDAFGGLNTATHTFSPVLLNDYQERVTYDPNGNILTYNRNGNQAANEAMDRLVYTYGTTNNQLNTLVDNASDGTYTTDIKAPAASPIQYSYDHIGNMTQDGSNSINWTVYGKIASQTGASGTISYQYDAASNRISKTTSTGTTLYVRDPQGNVLATYQRGTSGGFAQLEIDLYGSSRLGMTRAPAPPSQTINLSGSNTAYVTSFTRGLKSYELANHLGNVLLTITDKKNAVSLGGSLIDGYKPDFVTIQDYYPFGMQMPGRTFTASGAGAYRYGFNGKENDNDVKGVGDQIDYGMRIYDPRVGRFMSVDPLTTKYPWYTPYQFAGNKPTWATDLDGLEENTTSTFVKPPTTRFFVQNFYTIDLNNAKVAAIATRKFGDPKGVVSTTNFIVAGKSVFALPQGVTPKEGLATLYDRFYDTRDGTISDPGVGSYDELLRGSLMLHSPHDQREVFIEQLSEKFINAVNNLLIGAAPAEAIYEDLGMMSTGKPLSGADIGKGSLIIEEGVEFSQSEINAARYLTSLDNNVLLRKPTGTRAGGGTSDLLVNGSLRYDVYTPKTSNLSRIVSAIAKKNSQASGVVLDLSNTSINISRNEIPELLKRVQKSGAKNINDIIVIGGNKK